MYNINFLYWYMRQLSKDSIGSFFSLYFLNKIISTHHLTVLTIWFITSIDEKGKHVSSDY